MDKPWEKMSSWSSGIAIMTPGDKGLLSVTFEILPTVTGEKQQLITRISVHPYVYVYVCLCVCVYVYVYVHVHVHAYAYTYVYVYVYVYVWAVEFKFFSLILDSSVGLSAGIQSAEDWVSEDWVRILLSAEEDNLSPFDSKIACLCQSIEINNNKYVCMSHSS